MIYAENPSPFIEQLKRIHQITGTHNQTGLAAYLGVRRSAVTNAKRTGMIPAEWLLTLLRVANVNPEWILSGAGPCRFRRQTEDVYEDGETAWERQKTMRPCNGCPHARWRTSWSGASPWWKRNGFCLHPRRRNRNRGADVVISTQQPRSAANKSSPENRD